MAITTPSSPVFGSPTSFVSFITVASLSCALFRLISAYLVDKRPAVVLWIAELGITCSALVSFMYSLIALGTFI